MRDLDGNLVVNLLWVNDRLVTLTILFVSPHSCFARKDRSEWWDGWHEPIQEINICLILRPSSPPEAPEGRRKERMRERREEAKVDMLGSRLWRFLSFPHLHHQRYGIPTPREGKMITLWIDYGITFSLHSHLTQGSLVPTWCNPIREIRNGNSQRKSVNMMPLTSEIRDLSQFQRLLLRHHM